MLQFWSHWDPPIFHNQWVELPKKGKIWWHMGILWKLLVLNKHFQTHMTLERVLKLAFSVNTVLDRVILQRDFHLFKKVVQEPHVCLLCFNCVREEGIGLVGVHLFLRGPFHTDDERCLWDVLLDNSACFFIELKTETAILLNQIRFSFMQIPKGHVKSPKTY